MAAVTDRCICLRSLEYSETSQVLLLLGRNHGLLRVIAKGAHRRTKAGAGKFDGGVDLLELGHAAFIASPDRELGTLTEWKLIDGHPALRRHLRGMYLGMYAAELVGLLIEQHDPHPEIFDALERTLGDLGGRSDEEAFLAFELQLLTHSGYAPVLKACANCGLALVQGDPCYFSAARGGIVCRNCEAACPDRLAVDARLIAVARAIMRMPQRLPHLTRHQTDPLNRMLAAHVQHTLGKELRVAAYVV